MPPTSSVVVKLSLEPSRNSLSSCSISTGPDGIIIDDGGVDIDDGVDCDGCGNAFAVVAFTVDAFDDAVDKGAFDGLWLDGVSSGSISIGTGVVLMSTHTFVSFAFVIDVNLPFSRVFP